jgi:hypothetical protein
MRGNDRQLRNARSLKGPGRVIRYLPSLASLAKLASTDGDRRTLLGTSRPTPAVVCSKIYEAPRD